MKEAQYSHIKITAEISKATGASQSFSYGFHSKVIDTALPFNNHKAERGSVWYSLFFEFQLHNSISFFHFDLEFPIIDCSFHKFNLNSTQTIKKGIVHCSIILFKYIKKYNIKCFVSYSRKYLYNKDQTSNWKLYPHFYALYSSKLLGLTCACTWKKKKKSGTLSTPTKLIATFSLTKGAESYSLFRSSLLDRKLV